MQFLDLILKRVFSQEAIFVLDWRQHPSNNQLYRELLAQPTNMFWPITKPVGRANGYLTQRQQVVHRDFSLLSILVQLTILLNSYVLAVYSRNHGGIKKNFRRTRISDFALGIESYFTGKLTLTCLKQQCLLKNLFALCLFDYPGMFIRLLEVIIYWEGLL